MGITKYLAFLKILCDVLLQQGLHCEFIAAGLDCSNSTSKNEHKSDPFSCESFLQCSSGQWISMPCGTGTVFSASVGVCAKKTENTQCSATLSSPAPMNQTTAANKQVPTSGHITKSEPTPTTMASQSGTPNKPHTSTQSTPSNAEFRYLIPLPNVKNGVFNNPDKDYRLFLTSPNAQTTEVSIELASANRTTSYINDKFSLSRDTQLNLTYTSKQASLFMEVTGVYSDVISITASDVIEVMLMQTSTQKSPFSVMSVLPISSASTNYVIVTQPLYSEVQTDSFNSYSIVLATEDSTVVSLRFPHCPKSPVELIVNKMKIRAQRIEITLNDFQSLLTETTGDLTGTFVESDKPVLVFAGTVETDSHGSVDLTTSTQVLPISLADSSYVTFQTLYTTSDNTYYVTGIHDNTTVQIPGVARGKPKSYMSYHLHAGDILQFRLPATCCFILKADKAILVTEHMKFKAATSGSNVGYTDSSITTRACSINLAPDTVWLSSYSWTLPDYVETEEDFHFFLHVVVRSVNKFNLRLHNPKGDVSISWTDNSQTAIGYSEGHARIVIGFYSLAADSQDIKFAAYLIGRASNVTMCKAFSGFLPENTYFPYPDWSSNKGQRMIHISDPSTQQPSDDTTKSTVAGSVATDLTGLDYSKEWTTEALEVIGENIKTLEESERLAKEIENELTIQPKSTSLHRRKLESAEDARPTSAGIGAIGIILCSVLICFFVSFDFIRVLVWFHGKVRNKFTAFDKTTSSVDNKRYISTIV